jgi:hypothetical protein
MNNALTFFVTKYTDSVEFLVQQMPARLWEHCEIRGEAPGSGAVAVEQFGSVTMSPVTGRLQPVNFDDTPTDRRWVFPAMFYKADAVDTFEKLEMAISPDGWISKAQTFAANRQKDDTVISALFGTALTGNTSTTSNAPSTSVPFPAAQQISVSVGSSGGATPTGMNVPKLRAARKKMGAAEVDLDFEMPVVAMSAAQMDDMLNQAQAISLDFNEKPVLVDGKITRFMGMDFVHSERLPLNASSQRRNPVWVKSGMRAAVWEDITTDIRQRPDLINNPYQVSVTMMVGATRLQEFKVVELPCVES